MAATVASHPVYTEPYYQFNNSHVRPQQDSLHDNDVYPGDSTAIGNRKKREPYPESGAGGSKALGRGNEAWSNNKVVWVTLGVVTAGVGLALLANYYLTRHAVKKGTMESLARQAALQQQNQ